MLIHEMKDMELSGILKLWFVFWTASAQDRREECATRGNQDRMINNLGIAFPVREMT